MKRTLVVAADVQASQNPVPSPGPSTGLGASLDSDLLSALTGRQAGRDCTVAFRTRRVVSASHGVIREQQAGRRRIRAMALAAVVLVVLVLGPLVWVAVNSLIEDEHWRDLPSQFAMWVAILCPALVGCALLAGWVRQRG